MMLVILKCLFYSFLCYKLASNSVFYLFLHGAYQREEMKMLMNSHYRVVSSSCITLFLAIFFFLL